MHRVAVPCALVAGVMLVASAPAGRDRAGAGIFVAGAVLMFSASSLVHLRRWPIPTWEVLFRIDHGAIFVLIAASATPIGLSALDGRAAALLLWAVWIGAGVGVGVRLLPFHPPRGLMNSLFIGLGWVPIVVAPDYSVRWNRWSWRWLGFGGAALQRGCADAGGPLARPVAGGVRLPRGLARPGTPAWGSTSCLSPSWLRGDRFRVTNRLSLALVLSSWQSLGLRGRPVTDPRRATSCPGVGRGRGGPPPRRSSTPGGAHCGRPGGRRPCAAVPRDRTHPSS
ncbi:MAG: hypothetical protein CM1200mP26_13690 [Acidimicrobiales bacterium]|nr:MAG: hypothetical protein CM1200mP26_13690 [Acidimicrobiales bacterium]